MSRVDHGLPIVRTPARINFDGNSRRKFLDHDRTKKYVRDCNNVIKRLFIYLARKRSVRSDSFPVAVRQTLMRVRLPVRGMYLFPRQMRNVSVEGGSKRYDNVNRVTMPAAVFLRHNDEGEIRPRSRPSKKKARVNSPRGRLSFCLSPQSLAVTCQLTRLSSNIYVVGVTTKAVIMATHAIL